MKVKDLIEQLSKCDPESDVSIMMYVDCYGYVTEECTSFDYSYSEKSVTLG